MSLWTIPLILVLFAGPSEQEPPIETQPPGFSITGIQVKGARWVSASLILSEARLTEGNTYTEQDLLLASRRITRLPFVLAAEFSLGKGKEYGTYTLIIDIRESKPWLLEFAYFEQTRDQNIPPPDSQEPFISQDTGANRGQDVLSMGVRRHVRSYGMVYLLTRLENDDLKIDFAPGYPIDLGFNHYNLFGKRVFVNFNLQFRAETEEVILDRFDEVEATVIGTRPVLPSLSLSWPIARSQFITASIDYFEETQDFEDGNQGRGGNDGRGGPRGGGQLFRDEITDKRFNYSLSWLYNTTDDLTLPNTGSKIDLGIRFARQKSIFRLERPNRPDRPLPPDFGITEREAESQRFSYDLAHYFSLGNRSVLGLEGDGSIRLSGSNDQEDILRNRWNFESFYHVDLWNTGKTERFGDLRFELSAGLSGARLENWSEEGSFVQAGLVFRNDWGLIRVGYRYDRFDIERTQRRPPGRNKELP